MLGLYKQVPNKIKCDPVNTVIVEMRCGRWLCNKIIFWRDAFFIDWNMFGHLTISTPPRLRLWLLLFPYRKPHRALFIGVMAGGTVSERGLGVLRTPPPPLKNSWIKPFWLCSVLWPSRISLSDHWCDHRLQLNNIFCQLLLFFRNS